MFASVLPNRNLFATGAQQAIARAVADMALIYLDDPAATEQIAGMGRKAACLNADVSYIAMLPDLGAQTTDRLGGPNILVNSARIYLSKPVLDLIDATWDATLTVNLKATVFLSQLSPCGVAMLASWTEASSRYRP